MINVPGQISMIHTCLKACSRATERALEPATIPWEYWSPSRTIAGWITVEGMLQQPKKVNKWMHIIYAELLLFFWLVLPDFLCQGRFATVLVEMRKKTDFVTIIGAERDLKYSRGKRDEAHTVKIQTLRRSQVYRHHPAQQAVGTGNKSSNINGTHLKRSNLCSSIVIWCLEEMFGIITLLCAIERSVWMWVIHTSVSCKYKHL